MYAYTPSLKLLFICILAMPLRLRMGLSRDQDEHSFDLPFIKVETGYFLIHDAVVNAGHI